MELQRSQLSGRSSRRSVIKGFKALKANEELPKTDYYVRKVCGNTLKNGAPVRCPICGASRAQFLKVT